MALFKIEPAPMKGAEGDTKYVVDHERGAWLQRVTGVGRELGATFQLKQGGATVPFEAIKDDQKPDPAGSLGHFVWHFEVFGRSKFARHAAGIQPYTPWRRNRHLILHITAIVG